MGKTTKYSPEVRERNILRYLVSLAGVAVFCVLPLAAGAGEHTIVPPPVEMVPAGAFIAGSDREERELAYRLDEAAYGHSRTRERGWYEHEMPRQQLQTSAYAITRSPITNAQYEAFVSATDHRAPDVAPDVWAEYGLIHPFKSTRRFAWTGGTPPAGRENHPVVLVSHGDAMAYAAWLSEVTGATWRLPTEVEWEKAARGTEGQLFPWGSTWDPNRLNSADAGPYDTVPVGSYPQSASPFGLLDPSGQVYEWTASPGEKGGYVVKGGSWDDQGCGVCRPAARHVRPADLKHILVGFRLVRELD
ncbi:hypothetical protein GCM10007160_04780 [Litchfieldella qijiaojingensis]|uniref:Sulfatase-modifying factor enzyme-like domain-containing protein n=1 Tax=Litchfieldella qijiaojingensis TaxID=980347 RepID=A0ABQ2YDC1_9GAMM|nr:SUMF1/EgtB/PvdO family nonheme iron enzyme [Halomonas qijiaojingensis]GGX80625.1 hypothetical protein GCM10007160_04780 [Halomonas qijiaojingensis]